VYDRKSRKTISYSNHVLRRTGDEEGSGDHVMKKRNAEQISVNMAIGEEVMENLFFSNANCGTLKTNVQIKIRENPSRCSAVKSCVYPERRMDITIRVCVIFLHDVQNSSGHCSSERNLVCS
jgi:hypothetical protein